MILSVPTTVNASSPAATVLIVHTSERYCDATVFFDQIHRQQAAYDNEVTTMDPKNDLQLGICQAIETHLRAEYEAIPELTDALCIVGLDNSIIAVKQKFGFAKNEKVLNHPAIDGIVAHVVDIGVDNIGKDNDVTLKDYVALITSIKKSVIRHSSFGPCAYYEFIRNFV